MALAYDDFHGLSHQLRFLLFEIGIGLPQQAVDSFITLAHQKCLQQLQQAAVVEGLSDAEIPSHDVHDFLNQLQRMLKQKQPASLFFHWQSFRDKLDETIANNAMAHAYRQRWARELARKISSSSSFWTWLCEKNSAQEAFQLLEQWGSIRHPCYSDFQAKIGFSRREVLQYSAEFNAQTSLHWCALDKQQSSIRGNKTLYEELMVRQFPKEYRLWQEKLRFKQCNPDAYFAIPLHTWQWRNSIQPAFSSLIDNKQLILLPHHQTVKPSMDLNTMMPQDLNACHIKLNLSLHKPEELSQTAVNHNPGLARWLNKLLQKHNNYQQRFFIASDLAGLAVQSESACQQSKLAVLLSENPSQRIKESQRIIPIAALFAHSPLSSKPLLLEIIQASKLNPIDYFQDYCSLVLSSQLHLLLYYGIALGGNSQSLLIVFEHNRPQAVMIRKCSDIRIGNNQIYETQPPLEFKDNLAVIASSHDEIRDLFIQSNLQSNLAVWISCLSQHYALSPTTLWQIVHTILANQLSHLSSEINPQIFLLQQKHLLSSPWQQPNLLSMHLQGSKNRSYHLITNPLNQAEA